MSKPEKIQDAEGGETPLRDQGAGPAEDVSDRQVSRDDQASRHGHGAASKKADREERLAEALRANLRRRKQSD